MSNEKDPKDMNENELWDMLQQPLENENKSKPKRQKSPKPEKEAKEKAKPEKQEPSPTPEKSGSGRDIAVKILAVALVVVLAVLAIQVVGNSGGDTAALEARIAELEAEAAKREQYVADLEATLVQITTSTEYIEGEYAAANGENGELSEKVTAYENLVAALNAMLTYDEEGLNAALEELNPRITYLSNDALNAYYMVMEYMEQPYWFAQ